MYIAHNIYAINAQRQFNIVDSKVRKSTEKLSSGYRINRAADDAAGLSISEKMRRQIRGLNRASANCQDGISLVQVADGALNETHSILQRMNELAIQSANGTNSGSDRAAIEAEKDALVSELDRIANTTTFNNDIYPLLGKSTPEDIPMKTLTYETVSIDDVKLAGSATLSKEAADTYVGWTPFEKPDKFDALKLEAIIDDRNNEFPIDKYSLLYNDGSTAHSKIRISNALDIVQQNNPPEQYEVNMKDFHYDGNCAFDAANRKWTRSFSWSNPNGDVQIKVEQSVQIDDVRKNYIITNSVSSEGTTPALFEFMMNMDTAYNNNDRCEGYYVDKKELTKNSIYNNYDGQYDNALFEKWMDTSMSQYIYDKADYPNSISIVNRDFQDMLPFTEKISFDSSPQKPVISIGDYYKASASWNYFKTSGPSQGLGADAVGTDRTTTLIWSTGTTATSLSAANQHSAYQFSFTYGVDSVKRDTNIPAVPAKAFKTIQVPDLDAVKKDEGPETLRIWAGTSSDVENGIYLHLVDATPKTLGVADIDLSTEDGATKSINAINNAISKASKYRSYFGAVQNRMEHTIENLDNVSENTSASELRIRDTDMADEMVDYSKNNIIEQASQYVLAQANQSTQGVLSLLQ